MKIRSMRKQDLFNVAKVHKEAFPRQLHSEQWITCNFNAYPRIRLFVAEDEGTILGYVQWIEKSGFRKEVVLELEQIAVLPLQQKHGVGSLLISESLKMIKEEYFEEEDRIARKQRNRIYEILSLRYSAFEQSKRFLHERFA